MQSSQPRLSSQVRRSPARHITVIQADGTVVRALHPESQGDASARLNALISEALGGHVLEPWSIGSRPVELVLDDAPANEDLALALLFAKKAS